MPPPSDQDVHRTPASNAYIEAIVQRTVRETLLQIGIVTTNDQDMRETQRDFAYLRDLRVGSMAMKSKGVLAVIGIIVTAFATLLWIGLHALMHSGSAIPPHGG